VWVEIHNAFDHKPTPPSHPGFIAPTPILAAISAKFLGRHDRDKLAPRCGMGVIAWNAGLDHALHEARVLRRHEASPAIPAKG